MSRSAIRAGDVIQFPGGPRDEEALREELSNLYDVVDQSRIEVTRIVDHYSKWGVRSSTSLRELAEDASHIDDDVQMVTDLEEQIDEANIQIDELRQALSDL